MQPFTLKPVFRFETQTSVWDTESGRWKSHRLKEPRLAVNTPQNFTDEQKEFLAEGTALLAEKIRLDNELYHAMEDRRKVGPDELIALNYTIARQYGYEQIEETPAMRQLMDYLWHLADRQKLGQLMWDAFEDEVERWLLLVLDKLEAIGVKPRALEKEAAGV